MLKTKTLSAGDLAFPCSPVLPTVPTQQRWLGKQRGIQESRLKNYKPQHAHPPCFYMTRSKKEWRRLRLKEISHWTVWDLRTQVSHEREDKTEKTKQLQATLALLKLAQLFEVSIHYTEKFAIVTRWKTRALKHPRAIFKESKAVVLSLTTGFRHHKCCFTLSE